MSSDPSGGLETKPVINIVGKKVALGPMRQDLIPLYLKWFNDFEVTRTLSLDFRPLTLAAYEIWDEEVSKEDSTLPFTIYERATMRPIGRTDLYEVNHFHRSAEFRIIIGEKDFWNRGYGTETAMLMLDYGFNGLGLHNVMLCAASFNELGLSAYRRAGFKEIGRRRQAWRIGGEGFDIVLMDCLATEFDSRSISPELNGLV